MLNQFSAWARPIAGFGHTLLWPLGFAATLAVSTLLALGLIDELEYEQAAIMRSDGIEHELQQMLRLTVDVETATRGFVITRDPRFLKPATLAFPRIDAGLDRLRTLTADSPAVAGALRELDLAIDVRLAHARRLQNDAQAGAPIGIDDMLASKDLQDRIRAVIAHIGAQERALRERSKQRSAQVRIGLKSAIVLSTLVLGMLGWVWFRARRRLQRTQDNYRHLFSIAADGIALVGADGRILQVNASYAGMLGYTQSELIGMDFSLLGHPAERTHAQEAWQHLAGGEPQGLRSERRYLHKDGSEVWVRSTMSRTRGAADGSAQVLVIAEDVSRRIRNEELLRRSSVLLRNAGRMAAIDGWFLALPAGPLHVGAHLKSLLNLDDDRPAALLARLGPRSRTKLLRALSRCRRGERAFDIELEADSSPAPLVLRVMGQPAHGPHGLAGIDGAVQDITGQKRTERSLLKSEQRFRAAAQVTNDGIWDWDVAAGTIWRSPSIAALVGLDREALDGSMAAWQRLIHPDDRAAVAASLEPVLQGMADEFEAAYRVLRADGSHAYVLDKACALRDDDGATVRMVGGIRDLSERRRSQQALMGMAATVPDGDSDAFFLVLLTHLLEAVGADGGAIARPMAHAPASMRTIAVLVDGKPLDQLEYELASSPCARFDVQDEYVVPDGLAAACPDARGLPGLQARAYAGRRLATADGRQLGVIFMMFRSPVADQEGLTAVLRVFAARAGAELERMDGALRMREQAALLDQAREAIVVLGLDLVVKFWNRGAELMYGIVPQQSLGSPILSLYEDEQAARGALAAVLECGQWRGESVQRRGDGSALTVDESWTLVRDDHGAPHSILKVGSDVTDKRAAEERVRDLAYYDVLTGLPNRRLLTDRLRQRILRNGRHGRRGALLFIDMDNFKTLNDTHGHDAGDEFLRQAAARLRTCVRADDTVARLGGDEFVILLDSLDADAGTATQLARAVGASVVNAFRRPVVIGAIEHCSTASVGIVLVSGADEDVDALLRKADQAMYQAKNGGRNAVAVAHEAAQEQPGPAAGALLHALDTGELELWLEPEVDAAGAVSGAAASVRWRRGPDELVDSGELLACAARCGLAPRLEAWTLRCCAEAMSRWEAAPDGAARRLTLALTQQQLHDPGFGKRVLAVLDTHGCRAGGLALELPETGLEGAAATANIALLRAAGVRVAIADFGLDARSLGRLRQLDVDAVRLDAGLVPSGAQAPVDRAAVRAILGLARELGLVVVAGDVADCAQQSILVESGCSYLRGPLYGPAVPAPRAAYA